MITIIILQLIINLLFLNILYATAKLYKLKVNIHNLPLVIMLLLLMVLGSYGFVTKLFAFIIIGIMFATIFLITEEFTINEKTKSISTIKKILISICVTFTWVQIIGLTIFYSYNNEKIKINEKL